jgi:LytR cell envelope-related transcriptional attenuator
MDAPFPGPNELVRPWRRATLVASAVAALELVLLIGAGAMLLAKPVSHAIKRQAEAAAVPSPPKTLEQAIRRMNAPAGKARPRSHVRVMVLNGNGRAGAAASAAGRLHGLGYTIAGTANAKHQNYATSVVMYKQGYRAEGIRLGHDLGIKVVGPLDGIRASSLKGGELAVILGA